MFKSILAISVVAALVSLVSADAPGHHSGLEARQPYTNSEAFARGLPPLRPRHRGSRTWTAVKRQSSPVFRSTVLRFDDASFNSEDGPIESPYQGLNLGCVYGGCGYARGSSFPGWTAKSAPNAMYFYDQGFPSFTTAATGGNIQLKSLYCTQSAGSALNTLLVTGRTDSKTIFVEEITCTPNGPEGTDEGPTFNQFPSDLPSAPIVEFYVNTVTGDDAWTLDDISVNIVV